MGDDYKNNMIRNVDISDEDILDAMKEIPGYLDITTGDFRELYKFAYRHAMSRIAVSVKAKKIMTKEVISVTPETPLKEVAQLMAERSISGLPVVTNDNMVSGVISERDFLAGMGAKNVRTFMDVVAECLKGKGCAAVTIRAQTAGDIMSSPAVTVGMDTTLNEIIGLFKDKNINRVPVLDNEKRLAGIITRADIISASFIKHGSQ